uniref:Uncharacterized protein n=1 Tax=viral metagenome TaxID=1070528 RepID=A0A6C0I6U7_9ZZZZ
MSFKQHVEKILENSQKITPKTHQHSFSPHSPISPHSPKTPQHSFSPHSPISPKKQKKYLFLCFFTHGVYGRAAQPYNANPHASVNIKTFHSVPKLMTYLSCSPGSSLLGAAGGSDNIILADYFRRNGDFDMLDKTDYEEPSYKIKTTDQMLSHNYLGYINTAFDNLEIRPSHRTERFKITNPTDVDVCRNSFICDNKIGIGHNFPNKTYSTTDRPTHTNVGHNWGIFIYNNNCGIKPGTSIQNIETIDKEVVEDEEGFITGLIFTLENIIKGLTQEFGLTEDDYLFLFDYSCNNFGTKYINPKDDQRVIRRLGRSISKDFGFGKRKKNKGTRKVLKGKLKNKRVNKNSLNKSRRKLIK